MQDQKRQAVAVPETVTEPKPLPENEAPAPAVVNPAAESRFHHPDPFPERANPETDPTVAPAGQVLQQTEIGVNPVVNPRQVPRYYRKP